MSASCDCDRGADHEAVLATSPPPQQSPTAEWTGDFDEYSARVSEFSSIRAVAWDSPGHLPWVVVSQTPCPDVDGVAPQQANYSCRLKHLHWHAASGQRWSPA